MANLIDRDWLCAGSVRVIKNPQDALDFLLDRIENAKLLDAVPVVHGRWEKSDIPHEKYCCSACGCACWYYDYWGEVARSRYCPTCGAKMDGGAE